MADEENNRPVRWGQIMMIVTIVGVLVLPSGAVVWQGGAISAKLDYAIAQFVRVESSMYTKDMARADIASLNSFYNGLDIRQRVTEEELKEIRRRLDKR